MFEDCSCCFPVLEDHIHTRSTFPKTYAGKQDEHIRSQRRRHSNPIESIEPWILFRRFKWKLWFHRSRQVTHQYRYHICWNVVDLCLSLSIVFNLCRLHVLLHGFLSNRNDKHTSHEARPSPRPDLRPGRQVLDLSHVKTQRLVAESLRRSKIWRVGKGGKRNL